MYTLTFKGHSYAISGPLFFVIVLPMLAIFVSLAGWCGYMGYQASAMLSYYTTIPAFLAGIIMAVLLISVTITRNGDRN